MRALSLCVLLPVLAVTGCSMTSTPSTVNDPIEHAANSVQGTVYGGQQPIVGAVVRLWAAGTSYGSGATNFASATTTTGNKGQFTFANYTCPSANVPTYLTAQGGNSGYGTGNNNAIMLVAGLGPCSGTANLTVQINEVSTAATAFALSHFFTTQLGSSSTDSFGGAATAAEGNNAGLAMADAYTIPTLISLATGQANTSTSAITLESAKMYSLANIIAACVNSAGGTSGDGSYCGNLFQDTTPPNGTTAPTDTLQAAVQIALYPYNNVSALYSLPPAASPFVGLTATPNDWTIGVAYTSANFGLGIHAYNTSPTATQTSSTIDIDASGRVWFPTTLSSSHGLAYFDPTSNSFNGPYGTTLDHPQYLAIDLTGEAYGTDINLPNIVGVNTTSPGSQVVYTAPSNSITGPIGVENDTTLPNVVVYTAITGTQGSSLYSLQGGNQALVSTLLQTPTGIAPYAYKNGSDYIEAEVATFLAGGSPCYLETSYTDPDDQDPDENYINAQSNANPCVTAGAAQINQINGESAIVATSLNRICSYEVNDCFAPTVPLNAPEGIAVDGDNNIWIANSGNGSISTLLFTQVAKNSTANYMTTSPIQYKHNSANGNTSTTPYGIAVDRSGNVWTSNAGCVSTTAAACTPGSFVLSELVGAAAPTLTPLALMTTTAYSPTRPQAVPRPVQENASGVTAHQRKNVHQQ